MEPTHLDHLLLSEDSSKDCPSRVELNHHEREIQGTQKLLDEIQKALKCYQGSINSLSHKSGVDPKTIRKMHSGQYKRAPNAETVQRVLSVVSKQRTVKNIASFYGGSIELFLKKCLPQFFATDAVIADDYQFSEELNSKIKDVYAYVTAKLVGDNDSNGTNKYQLIDELCKFIIKHESELFENDISPDEVSTFRPLATLKINQMIKSGLLVENRDNGTVHLFKTDFYWHVNDDLYSKYEGGMYNFFEPEHTQYSDEWWQVFFSSCSIKEFNQISHIMYDAFSKAKTVLRNSKSNQIKVNLNTALISMKFHTASEAREEALERKRQKSKI